MNIEQYRARDARIAIGLPIKQDNNEFEYPGYLDATLIAFFPNIHSANLALHNLIDKEQTMASWSTFVPPGTGPGEDLPDDIPPNPGPK